MGDTEALEARVSSLEAQVQRQSNLLTEQQGMIADMNMAVRNQRDPRVDVLIGIVANVAQDPFNSGAWDRVRNLIRGLQGDPTGAGPQPDDSTDG